jgi:hypothetical protein
VLRSANDVPPRGLLCIPLVEIRSESRANPLKSMHSTG